MDEQENINIPDSILKEESDPVVEEEDLDKSEEQSVKDENECIEADKIEENDDKSDDNDEEFKQDEVEQVKEVQKTPEKMELDMDVPETETETEPLNLGSDSENKAIANEQENQNTDESFESMENAQTAASEPLQTSNEKEHADSDGADEEDDNEDEAKLDFHIGRTVTLQMLLAAKLLEPGKAAMTIEYLGQKFVGDLLPDGKIKSVETETIFCSPSAWAMHCKRIINPEKKSGCGWASVRYKNKKLDAIKTTYLRKRQLQKDSNLSDEGDPDVELKPELSEVEIKRIVLPYNTVNNRNIVHDPNTLVETVPFASQNKLQPFLVTISTSSVLLLDFHCHLTKQEVCGYLGGSWDNNTQTLAITHAFPVRNSRHDRHFAIEVEQQIQRNMLKKNLILVGWYHSHPRIAAQPTLRDCDAQLEYQIKMRGISDETYTPCVGLICSPYYSENPTLESSITAFWVVPPAENRSMEYGRPMSMQFSVNQDLEMSDHIKTEMVLAIDYYQQFDNEMVKFDLKYGDDSTFIEKLKTTLYSKFPREQNDFEFWNWLRQHLSLSPEDEFSPPKWSSRDTVQPPVTVASVAPINENLPMALELSKKESITISLDSDSKDNEMREHIDPDVVVIKDDESDANAEDSKELSDKLAIRSLQEQLKLPSGLNMTPSPISSIPLLKPTPPVKSTVPLVSPRDSPITIPSSSASPATKFDIPPPATPSPAKSDASSNRNRNSPMPTNLTKYPSSLLNAPGKGNPTDPALAATKAMEEFLAANFSGGKFPGYSPEEYSALLQQASSKDLASAANLLTGPSQATEKHTTSLPGTGGAEQATNMKEFLSQLEKSTELSLLLQQQYQYPGMSGMPNISQGASLGSNSQTNISKSTKQQKRTSRSSSTTSTTSQPRNYEDDFKNDAGKLNEYIRSQEYAKLLFEQAEALNVAVAHQNYGEISSIASAINTLPSNTSVSPMPSRKSRKSTSTPQSMPQQPSLAELSQMLHGSGASDAKVHELFRQMEANAAALNSNPKQSQKHQHQQQQQQQQQQQHQMSSIQRQLTQSGKSSSSSSSSKKQTANNNQLNDYMSLLSQAKMPDLATLMAQSYGPGASAADLSMLFRSQYEQQGNKNNSDLATLNASMDMLGNLFSGGGANKNADINSLLFAQGGKQSSADLASIFAVTGQGLTPSSQYSSKSGSSISNPYYSQSNAALDKAQQELMALYAGNPMAAATGSGKYGSLQDPLSKSALASNSMFMNPSMYAKLQQDALNAMMMKPPKTSSKSDSKSRETSASPASRNYNRETSASPASRSYNNFSVADLAVSAVNQQSSSSQHKKQFSISDLVSPSPSKMMKFADNFSSYDLSKSAHGDDLLNLSGNGSDK